MDVRITVEIKKGGKCAAIERTDWASMPSDNMRLDRMAELALKPLADRLEKEALEKQRR